MTKWALSQKWKANLTFNVITSYSLLYLQNKGKISINAEAAFNQITHLWFKKKKKLRKLRLDRNILNFIKEIYEKPLTSYSTKILNDFCRTGDKTKKLTLNHSYVLWRLKSIRGEIMRKGLKIRNEEEWKHAYLENAKESKE